MEDNHETAPPEDVVFIETNNEPDQSAEPIPPAPEVEASTIAAYSQGMLTQQESNAAAIIQQAWRNRSLTKVGPAAPVVDVGVNPVDVDNEAAVAVAVLSHDESMLVEEIHTEDNVPEIQHGLLEETEDISVDNSEKPEGSFVSIEVEDTEPHHTLRLSGYFNVA
ncbi:hypothetical protein BC830DRAFT_644752 [Chytriomyces sp. MP71]|nr:hypothetical protein BC830DRAFT_644752 [Chytriomyces sp. MP71]